MAAKNKDDVQITHYKNPMGTDGFEFIEFASDQPEHLMTLFECLGFTRVAKHRSKEVFLYRQGDIHFIVNAEPNSYEQAFARRHGPCACGMGFRVKNAIQAFQRAREIGIPEHDAHPNYMELKLPAIYGVGGSVLYLIDRYGESNIYDVDFKAVSGTANNKNSVGLTYIDHVTHNVKQGDMDRWAKYYERLFNFHEIKHFTITGQHTGLFSRAMGSPDGKIRITINESADDKSQIQEFLDQYKGAGIQHIALGTDDICRTVEALKGNGIRFLDTPDSYFDRIDQRLPGHQENVERLRQNRILIDGAPEKGGGILLQIFTENEIGPIFFEIIQRKGNEGFGEGNFQALFDAMEQDQIDRGTLKTESGH